jgi:hypothetical protein
VTERHIVTDVEAADIRALADRWLQGDQAKRTRGKYLRDLLDTREELATSLFWCADVLHHAVEDLGEIEPYIGAASQADALLARLRGES